MNYGAIGLMLVFMTYMFLSQQKKEEVMFNKLGTVIDNNTIALTRFVDSVKKCEVKK
jgi:hypothetical protein